MEENIILCESCGYKGSVDTYHPTASVYSDVRCPKCGSTNNEHNESYQDNLLKAMSTLKIDKGNR